MTKNHFSIFDQTKKEFNNATNENKYAKLQHYLNTQKELRLELEKFEREKVEQRINAIIKHGGAGTDHFWKIRKKILSKGKDEKYDLITEEGEHITDPQKSKDYIADHFEERFQARPLSATKKSK